MIFVALLAIGARAEETSFLDAYPALKEYVYHEEPSNFYLGFGLSPIGVLKDRTVFSADFFQLHHISERWDYQILAASFGITRAQSSTYQSNNFLFTTSVQMRIGNTFSAGPLLGYEFVTFPSLNARLLKTPYETPSEAFSSQGLVYGAIVSQSFPYKSYLIQISELGYQQTYSNRHSPENWTYYYNAPEVRQNPSLVGPSFVAKVQFSFLF